MYSKGFLTPNRENRLIILDSRRNWYLGVVAATCVISAQSLIASAADASASVDTGAVETENAGQANSSVPPSPDTGRLYAYPAESETAPTFSLVTPAHFASAESSKKAKVPSSASEDSPNTMVHPFTGGTSKKAMVPPPGGEDSKNATVPSSENESSRKATVASTASEQSKNTTASSSASEESSAPVTAASPNVSISEPSEYAALLERKLFRRDYLDESMDERLVRLERFVFCEIRKGPPERRLMELVKIVRFDPNRLAAPAEVTSPIAPRAETSIATTIQPSSEYIREAPREQKKVSVKDVMEEGLQNFQAKRYHAAQENFELAAVLAPTDSATHYFLGVISLKLRDYDAARRELKLAFRLDPFGEFGQLAKASLLEATSQAVIHGRPPADPEAIVQQCLRQMRRQTRDRIALNIAKGGAYAQMRMRSGNDHLRRLADMPRGPRNPMAYMPNLNRDPYFISTDYQFRTNWLRTDYQSQAIIAHTDGIKRARTVQESANNLKELLSQSPRPGQPRLRAFGTNLYVRYYGDERVGESEIGEDPMLELRASAKRASPTQFRQFRVATPVPKPKRLLDW